MKSNAMAGAVSLVGIGICGIAVAMLLQTVGPRAEASPRGADAFGPGEPTVVWYGVTSGGWGTADHINWLLRAWSDGRVEGKRFLEGGSWYDCEGGVSCVGEWLVISDPQQGYAAFADVNADEIVDGVDLAAVIGQWGDAPRNQFPPSDCPLNLINP